MGHVFLVVSDGSVIGPPMILAAYVGDQADRVSQQHARCVTGASVLCVEARTELPASILDDITVEWDDIETPTPVDD